MIIPRWQERYEEDCEDSESGFSSWSSNKYMQDEIDALRKALAASEQRLLDLPGEMQELSGCENTAGVQACVAHVEYVLALVAKENEPPGPKLCVECEQPYCHGVCVERGDQDEAPE